MARDQREINRQFMALHKAYIEGDFFGDGNAFRLRHAYGALGPVLGGQTWSTFMDEDAMPSTLDFESPIAFPLSRLAQFRYTQKFDNGNYVAVALEDPSNKIVTPPGVPGVTENPIPDVTARLRYPLEVFTAMRYQRLRLRQDQNLPEWEGISR